jgi:hypothetical protein
MESETIGESKREWDMSQDDITAFWEKWGKK